MAKMHAEWIAVDWGTSNLRAWALSREGEVLQQAVSERGMAALSPDQFEPALLALIESWLAADRVTPVIACGMVGARQGWREAPYATLPCPPLAAARRVRPAVRDPRIDVQILPGLCQTQPADVMRGEDTQIAGVLHERPGFEGVICLPGTHCKWVEICQGRVVRMQTFMTGELFALLSRQSVLRYALQPEGEAPAWDQGAFNEAVEAMQVHPETLSSALFGLRAGHLLQGLSTTSGLARLSGLLIGAELAAARPFWSGHPVCVVGDRGLPARYRAALDLLAARVMAVDSDAITLAGLRAAYRQTVTQR